MSPDLPDSIVNIRFSGETGTDKRSKGGIAIYIGNIQRVLDACLQVGSIRNMIYVTVLLRSGFFSINYGLPYANTGLYHPPKHNSHELNVIY